jgi:hypothetical protein
MQIETAFDTRKETKMATKSKLKSGYGHAVDDLRKIFGEHWCGPDQLEPQVRTLIAVYGEPSSYEDAWVVEVYCTVYRPYMVYELEARNTGCRGDDERGLQNYTVVFDGRHYSRDFGLLAAGLAAAVSVGSVGVYPKDDE